MTTLFKYFYLVVIMSILLIYVYGAIATLLIYRELEDRMYLINTALYQSVDLTAVKQEALFSFTTQQQTERMFRTALQNGFSLDGNLAPTVSTPKYIAGPVRIQRVQTKDENQAVWMGPTNHQRGAFVNRNPAVYSEVVIPFRIPGILMPVQGSSVQTLTLLPVRP